MATQAFVYKLNLVDPVDISIKMPRYVVSTTDYKARRSVMFGLWRESTITSMLTHKLKGGKAEHIRSTASAIRERGQAFLPLDFLT